jgi:hypothetical protein
MRLVTALVGVVLAAGLSADVWLVMGANAAGWITTFIAAFAFMGVDALLGAETWYKRAPRARDRRVVLLGAFALAVCGSIGSIVWPGTLSWYLIGILAIPLMFVLLWGRSDDDISPPGGADGPWTAP